ncbi:MAG: 16S rRNA (cytidine(1402)-2'-O)-methyltransferase [Gammaproteobacteria bacterium]|nr:16S rRNA (cytidine(1402)-2'-O)-methyltransferase [Gammaproteobacteria bacterium]
MRPGDRTIVTKGRGTLQVVATPIGNLADLSPRARETLAQADLIVAEDTRHTRALLQSLGLSRPLLSLHAHNEAQRVPRLLERLESGARLVLVSDAGTPLLSDPGYELVRCAAAAGHCVQTVPGPSALTAALAVAGLPVQRFCFEGFLPPRGGERTARLAALATEERTLVLFESPHRIAALLEELVAQFGTERMAVVARELTKLHETIYRGTLGELLERARAEENFSRGEITLLVGGAAPRPAAIDLAALRRTVEILARELPPGRAAALAAQLTGATRQEAYALATALAGRPSKSGDRI